MTYYEFLLEEKEAGRLKKWLQLGAPSQLPKWMEYYELSLAHPKYSYSEISYHFKASRSTIYRAITFMRSPQVDVVSKN